MKPPKELTGNHIEKVQHKEITAFLQRADEGTRKISRWHQMCTCKGLMPVAPPTQNSLYKANQ